MFRDQYRTLRVTKENHIRCFTDIRSVLKIISISHDISNTASALKPLLVSVENTPLYVFFCI